MEIFRQIKRALGLEKPESFRRWSSSEIAENKLSSLGVSTRAWEVHYEAFRCLVKSGKSKELSLGVAVYRIRLNKLLEESAVPML